MKKIRRLIIKKYTKSGRDMNYEIGQEVYDGHKIHHMFERDNGEKIVYISKNGEVKEWKRLHSEVPTITEYEI